MPAKICFFLFLLVPTLFFTGTKDPFTLKETAAQSLILAAALTWIVRAVEEKQRIHKGALFFPLASFLGAILLSLKNAVHPALVLQFFFWQILLAFLYLIAANFKSEKEKNLMINAIALASLVSGIYGALQYFGWDFVQWSVQWDRRPSATFGNPNFAAGWWVMTLPVFFARFLDGKKTFRWFWFGIALLTSANLYWGRTRGAWIAMALSAIFSIAINFYLEKRSVSNVSISKTKFSIAVALILILFVLSAGFAFRKAERSTDISILERFFKWQTAQTIIRDYPLFGVGADHLKVHFALYQAKVRDHPMFKDLSFKATSESNVHNEYFQIWSELGTLGLIAFLGIFAAWFWRWLQSYFESDVSRRKEKIGILAAILSFLFYSLTNFPLHIAPCACLLFFLLGISESKSEPENAPSGKMTRKDKNSAPAVSENFWIRFAAIGIFLAVIVKIILPPLQADMLRLNAERAASQGDFSSAIMFYQKAIALDFYRSERTAYDLGEIYRRTGQIEDAIRSYEISLMLRNYGEIYNDIGNCYYLLHNHELAVKNWETAVRLGLPDVNAQRQAEKNLQIIKRIQEKTPDDSSRRPKK